MNARVLLVDDEPDVRRTYRDILEADGYQVTEASTGEEAVAKINGYRPDAILLDIGMPGKNGIEIARDLGRREDTRSIPIVIITALSSFPVGEGLDSIPGIRRFVYKPCRPRTLLEGVEDAIRYRH